MISEETFPPLFVAILNPNLQNNELINYRLSQKFKLLGNDDLII